jgi:hypothetical protein
MQVKIFDFSSLVESEKIEGNINSWLTANPSINVIHVKIEVLPGSGGESLFIFVFFEGPLGKGVFSEFTEELIG